MEEVPKKLLNSILFIFRMIDDGAGRNRILLTVDLLLIYTEYSHFVQIMK